MPREEKIRIMSVELLQKLSVISYFVAAIMLVIGFVLFFALDIRKVFGDVTGITAKKAINDIRQQNEMTGNKAYKPSTINSKRGKLTDKITPSGKLLKHSGNLKGSPGTEKFNTTELLPNNAAETTVLPSETTVLNQTAEETTVLVQPEKLIFSNDFKIESEISFSESSEIIE